MKYKNKSNFNNNSNPQKFGSFLNKSISKQSYDENSKKKSIEIQEDAKLKSIEEKFHLENSGIAIYPKEKIDKEIEDISFINELNEEDSFGLNSSVNYEYILSSCSEKLQKLILNYNQEFMPKINKSIIKCPLNNDNNEECCYIPIIKINKYNISFHCDNHDKTNTKKIEVIYLLNNINKLFLPGPRKRIPKNDNDTKFNINLMKENMPKFELNLSSLKRNIHKFINQIRKILTIKIENFKIFLNDYNKQKYDPKLSLKKIQQIYLPFLKKLNLLLYFYIIKRLIYEFENPFSLNPKNKTILLLNLKNAQDILKKKPKNIKKKKKGFNPIKFSWKQIFILKKK